MTIFALGAGAVWRQLHHAASLLAQVQSVADFPAQAAVDETCRFLRDRMTASLQAAPDLKPLASILTAAVPRDFPLLIAAMDVPPVSRRLNSDLKDDQGMIENLVGGLLHYLSLQDAPSSDATLWIRHLFVHGDDIGPGEDLEGTSLQRLQGVFVVSRVAHLDEDLRDILWDADVDLRLALQGFRSELEVVEKYERALFRSSVRPFGYPAAEYRLKVERLKSAFEGLKREDH